MEEVVDLIANLQVYIMVDPVVDPLVDLLANPWVDLLWAHTLVEGYLTMVPLQWAHGHDILGNLGYQLDIQHQLVQPLVPTS
jgi:hypothetical protein